MALAENNHHTAPRRQTKARAGRWERAVLHGQVPEHPTPQAAGAQHFAMDTGEDVGEAPAAGRPAPLLEVLPQERVQQRTEEQIVDPVPLVPLLHDVVPQMVEQLVDILAPLDFRVAGQVIEVPKIVCPPYAARTVLRAPQTADQLVEVPTNISYSSLLQQTLEQNVDIPVRGRGGRNVDHQGFLPRQSSTAPAVAQIVDKPASGGGLQSPSASFSSPAGVHDYAHEPGEGFFWTFPWVKKIRSPPRVRVRGCPPVAAHGLGRLMTRVLWLMTTNASLWTMLAVSGPGLLRTLVGPSWSVLATCSSSGSILLVEPGHSAHPMAAAVGQLSWWTYRQPTAVVGAWHSMFLRSCSACSSCFPIVVGAMDVDAQCTLRTGPWSSPVVVRQQVPWRLCSRMLDSTVDTCSASLPGCVRDEFHTIST